MRLKTASPWPNGRLPALWLLTDEARSADWAGIAAALPAGAGILLRHYRDSARRRLALELAAIARRRGLVLLIGADPALAAEVGAHGVHLPRWAQAHSVRARCRGLLTLSAHSLPEVVAARCLAPDGLFLAPVFATQSHEGAQSLGAVRFSAIARRSPAPVIALGGVSGSTAPRLLGSGAYGLGAIGALIP